MKGIVFMSKIERKKNFRNFIVIIKKNQTFFILMIFLMIGIVFGSICFKNADEKTIKTVNSLFLSNLNKKVTSPFLETFIVSSSFSFAFLIISFFLGLSLWGGILSPFVVFFKGFGAGFSFNYLFTTYGFQGIGFYMLILLPGTLISTFAILLLTRESIRFSFSVFTRIFPKIFIIKAREYLPQLYFLRSGFCFILTTIASSIEVFLFMFLGSFFKF